MDKINYFEMKFNAVGVNEGFARSVVGAFVVEINPTIEELEDIKTAVSEAVTNAIVHGYNGDSDKYVLLKCSLYSEKLEIIVEDYGVGIDDIDLAVQPFYTTKPDEERSGMGFTLMKSFMNEFELTSTVNKGTTVRMVKYFNREEDNARA